MNAHYIINQKTGIDTSFHILSSLLFINHAVIELYIMLVTESTVKSSELLNFLKVLSHDAPKVHSHFGHPVTVFSGGASSSYC
jgi:hypothetical protein